MTRTLTVACADLEARPLFWTEPGGQRRGFEPDVADIIFAAAGLPFEWVFLQWSDFLPSVAQGRTDAVLCGQGIIPERLEVVDFTDPYTVFNESVVMRAGQSVPSPSDLSGKRVAAIADSANMRLARTFTGAILVPFDGASDDVFGDMIGALRSGEVDAVVDDDVALIPLAGAPDIDLAFTVPTRNPWGIGVRKANDDLREQLNRAIAQVKQDGRLAEVWQRWVPELEYPF